jgi:long-chain acyl-CoA synthetase
MNLADLLRETAGTFPDKPALIFHDRPITFSQLDERVDLTAAALAGLGVVKGDRVALLIGNVPEFATSMYGAMRAGAAVCPLNVMLTPEEMGYILADSGAKAAVTELPTLPGLLSVRDRLADLQTILVVGGPPAPSRTISLEEALRSAGEPPAITIESSDLAVIAYTAGTTAAPKGAMLTHQSLLANLDQLSQVPDLAETHEDVAFLALPMFHIYALNVILGMTVKTGATAVMVERFEPEETLALIERHGVTVLFGAPPMFSALLALPDGPARALSGVRLAVSGAASLPAEVFEAFRDRFGVTIWEGYGLTECGPAVTSNAMGAEAKSGSIGLPLPGMEIRLVDEHGEDAEEDDPGELWVKGPNVFAGYWNRPEATAEVLEGEWLKTGDVAYRDEDGYIHLVDRKKDLIIVSGFNVYPTEIEEAIERHPKVVEAAVVGAPDERTGEAVQAWVVPKEGQSLTGEEILDFLHGYLARFKQPRDIEIVDELPHHVTGKVLRRVLRGEELLGDVQSEQAPQGGEGS